MSLAAPPGIDPAAVTDWIEGLGLGAEPPLRIERVGAGGSNLTFRVLDRRGRRWALRRAPRGERLESAHDVAREHRILAALAATAVPTPRPYALCRDPAVAAVPVLLMEWVDGLAVASERDALELSAVARGALGRSLAATLARVHAVDLEATGLADLSSHGPYAARQLRRWRRQWEATRRRPLPALDALGERLAASMPEQREVVLVHGDYHVLNVIADPGGGTVRALLDWELGTLGDPLADLGGLLAYWSEAGDRFGPGPFALTELPGFPTRDELARAYGAASGRDLSALPYWEALACWKIAIVFAGVLRRAEEEPGDAAPSRAWDEGVIERLVARGTALADRAGC
ncbi:MAG TPA: phosphotransferase family protein [Solirubrobacterales bacterium]|nr:phosphotransferase family protein [Solirubrobacterales bacterium]